MRTDRWLRAAFEPLATWLQTAQGFISISGEHWWFVGCDFAVPDHNCLVVTAAGDEGRAALAEGMALLKSRPWPALICVDAVVAPSLSREIDRLGLEPAGVLPHYLIELENLRLSGKTIEARLERVVNVEAFHEVMAVFAAAFDRRSYLDSDGEFGAGLLADPRLTFHLARVDGEPASALVTWRRNAMVYVTVMGTHPSFQARGIGRALLEWALTAECDSGATHAHLVASDAGARLYRAAGFELIADHRLWFVRPGL